MKYSRINNVIMIVLALIHLSEQGKRCVCHQCAHIRYEGRRCECCVYMLHGKKRSLETTFPIVSDSYDNSKNDNTQYDNTQYDNTQYDNTQYYNAQYDNTQYDNKQYDNTQYDGTKHDYAEVDNTQEDIYEDYNNIEQVNNDDNSKRGFTVKDVTYQNVNNVNGDKMDKYNYGKTVRQLLLIDYLTQINKLAAQRQTMKGYLNEVFDS